MLNYQRVYGLKENLTGLNLPQVLHRKIIDIPKVDGQCPTARVEYPRVWVKKRVGMNITNELTHEHVALTPSFHAQTHISDGPYRHDSIFPLPIFDA